MDLYNAQRTNFQTAMPRLATKPGQQRQTTQRSQNRGKAGVPMPPMPMTPGNAGRPPMLGKKPMPAGGEMSIMPVGKMRPSGGINPNGMIKKMAAFKPTGV